MAELTYRQRLALFCLAIEGEPCTGAELVEAMGLAAQGAGHPKNCWIDFSPARIVRDLQELEKRTLVARAAPKYNRTKGRDEPAWALVERPEVPVLPEPDGEQPTGHVVQVQPRPIAGNASRSPYGDLPVDQLLLLLDVHEEMAGIVGRFMREMGEFQRDARRRLLAAGFEFPQR
jgi:hypothetical protein